MSLFIAACVQLCSSDLLAHNIQQASYWINQAAKQGAGLILTPEMTGLFDMRPGRLLANAQTEQHDLALAALRKLAAQLKVNLIIGSLAIKVSDTHCVNRSYFIDAQGEIRARYDKIHLFDVKIDDGQIYQESSRIQPGEQAVLVAAHHADAGNASQPDAVYADAVYKVGLSICYDIRFAYLYRTLAQAGADIITIPAAFTVPTGQAHWHVLARARAIETGCFVLAAAQQGQHTDGRCTYGHSLIIDPWGNILAERPQDPGIILASIDLSQVTQARQKIPCLLHDRNMVLHVDTTDRIAISTTSVATTTIPTK
jgi:deaminated glutathione amidase